MDIKLEVNHDKAEPYRKSIVSGSKNYYRFHGIFSDDWNGLSKYLIFPDYECSVAFSHEDIAVLPESLIANEGILPFGVIGKDSGGELRISTNLVILRIINGVNEFDSLPPSPEDEATWETYIGKIAQGYIDKIKQSTSYISSIPSTVTVGGIEKGATFNAPGIDHNELWDMLLHPYVAPSVTISSSPSSSTVRELGVATNVTVTANVTQGSNKITSVKIYKGTEATDKNAASGVQSQVYSISSTTTFKAEVSDGINTVSKSLTYTFVNPFYYGSVSSAPTDSSSVKSLTKLIQSKGAKTVTHTTTATNGHYCFCYPSSYGNLQTILDGNGFNNTNDFTKTEVNVTTAAGTNILYNVYTYNNDVSEGTMNMTYQF